MALHLVSNVSDVWIDRLVIETTSVPLPRKNIPAGSKETFCCPPKKKHSRWEYRNVLFPTQEKTFPLEVQKRSVPHPRKNIPAGSTETFCCPPKKKRSRWKYRNVLLPTQEKLKRTDT